ncbi:NIPSNAP family protein [Actinomadura syzygii]|uniref:NIPSNAP family protein n=1 Tax=Actinomadura syzygii TaxID=1427538 RepID=A0A5D0TUF4_9ACTN|nr:NIPSNAP family protein [Actinomadura syzygii]TYC09818.1 NIPSNAP family protein [Actinomadura syzygii]
MSDDWAVVELRRYTLVPGGRDILTELFDREFVESQEAVGMRVIGQFHDEDDPNRYVWLRGFRDMEARKAALTAFYLEGDVWREHGAAARATMVDSSDVLLLRPVAEGSGFPATEPRPPVGAARPGARASATILYRGAPVDAAFSAFFDAEVVPFLTEMGAAPIARFQTEASENTFPRLPVRTGENVFVWFSLFESAADRRAHLDLLARSPKWSDQILPALDRGSAAPLERLRLVPTWRSALR